MTTEADTRAAVEAEIVAWLRSQATCGCKGAHGYCNQDGPPLGYADAIEAGDYRFVTIPRLNLGKQD